METYHLTGDCISRDKGELRALADGDFGPKVADRERNGLAEEPVGRVAHELKLIKVN